MTRWCSVTAADHDQPQQTDQTPEVERPEPSEEVLEKAREKTAGLEERYQPGARDSVVMPGTDGTISGTAINDWLDDDGNVKKD